MVLSALLEATMHVAGSCPVTLMSAQCATTADTPSPTLTR
jgi:hypothetical protein